MICDALLNTDVLIWYLRGNQHAHDLIHSLPAICLSAVTYMELVQGMRDKAELRLLQKTLMQWRARTILIDEEVSTRATVLVENHFLSHAMQMADALVGATAMMHGRYICNLTT